MQIVCWTKWNRTFTNSPPYLCILSRSSVQCFILAFTPDPELKLFICVICNVSLEMCCELWVLSGLQFVCFLWQTQPQKGTKALILGETQSAQSLIWTGRGCGCHCTPLSSVLSASPLCLYGWATKPPIKWRLICSWHMFSGSYDTLWYTYNTYFLVSVVVYFSTAFLHIMLLCQVTHLNGTQPSLMLIIWLGLQVKMSCQKDTLEHHRGCFYLTSMNNLHFFVSEHWKVQRLVQDDVQTDTQNTW